MPTMRPMLSRPSVRLLRALACASLLIAPLLAHGQAQPRRSRDRRVQRFRAEWRHRRRCRRGALRHDLVGIVGHGRADLPQFRRRSQVRTIYQMSTSEAYAPLAGLLVGSDGLLYGTTSLGAVGVVADTPVPCSASRRTAKASRSCIDSRRGTAIERQPECDQRGRSVSRDCADRGQRRLPVWRNARGRSHGTGAVFKVSRDGTSFKVLHTFGAVTSDANAAVPINLDGAAPLGVLLQGADGFLYGTTSVGRREWPRHDFPCRLRRQWLPVAARVPGPDRLCFAAGQCRWRVTAGGPRGRQGRALLRCCERRRREWLRHDIRVRPGWPVVERHAQLRGHRTAPLLPVR